MYTIKAPGPLTRLGPGNSSLIGRDQPEVFTLAQPETIDLIEVLQQTWRTICEAYDVSGSLPVTQCLFEGVNLRQPQQAAETLLANMLLEVMEEVGRFSPAYRQPIGLIHARDRITNQSVWLLSPETRERWEPMLSRLALAMNKNLGLLLAADVIGELAKGAPCDELRVLACCLCVPPRVILINRAVLGNANIVCDACQQPFHLVETPDDD